MKIMIHFLHLNEFKRKKMSSMLTRTEYDSVQYITAPDKTTWEDSF